MKAASADRKEIRPKRVAVLYTSVEYALADVPDELRETMDLAASARAATQSFRALGYSVRCLDFGNDACELAARLRAFQPDVVFNLAEGPLNCYEKEAHAAALLELLQLPYTGNGPIPLALCKNKALTKQILLAHGLPTPRYRVCSGDSEPLPRLSFPLVVKPLQEDGSIGIAEESIVTNKRELRVRIAHVIAQHRQNALVEEFVGGREFNVVVLGNGTAQDPYRTLAPGEYVYHSDRWRVCTFEAKWDETHPSYAAVEAHYPAKISASLGRQLQRITVACARIFDLSGYARIDFRLGNHGEPYVLEINPNPDLSPHTGTLRTAEVMGLDYSEFLQEILRLGLARGAR